MAAKRVCSFRMRQMASEPHFREGKMNLLKQEVSFLTTPDGVRLACGVSGNGTPLVKAPNWLSHVEFDWESPIWRHWWEALAKKHTLVRFDQRGCGLSDRDVEDLSFDRWVSDLEFVVDALGIDRFALLGMSQGAAVAVEYAARHSERLSHLEDFHGAGQNVEVHWMNTQHC